MSFEEKKIIEDSPNLFLGFQGFISEKPSKGPEEVEIRWGNIHFVICRIQFSEICVAFFVTLQKRYCLHIKFFHDYINFN